MVLILVLIVGVSLALPLDEEQLRRPRQIAPVPRPAAAAPVDSASQLSLFQLLFSTLMEFQRTFGPIISYLMKEKLNIIAALLRTPANGDLQFG